MLSIISFPPLTRSTGIEGLQRYHSSVTTGGLQTWAHPLTHPAAPMTYDRHTHVHLNQSIWTIPHTRQRCVWFGSPSASSSGFMAVGSAFSGFHLYREDCFCTCCLVVSFYYFIRFLLYPHSSQISWSCALVYLYPNSIFFYFVPSDLLAQEIFSVLA